MYPLRRNRRLRANESIRNLVRENTITPNDFLVPLFVVEGHGVKSEIASMPNYFRHSLDTLEKEVPNYIINKLIYYLIQKNLRIHIINMGMVQLEDLNILIIENLILIIPFNIIHKKK